MASFSIKPVHSLLAALVLLAIATLFFFFNTTESNEKKQADTSEGAGIFHSPLLCS